MAPGLRRKYFAIFLVGQPDSMINPGMARSSTVPVFQVRRLRALFFKLAFIGAGCHGTIPSHAASAQYQYVYDRAGRLMAVAGQGAATYAYDASGNLLQRSFSSLADADGDGLVTAQEIALGLNPANADSDGDGARDGEEVTAGTDPLNPASRFAIAAVTMASGGAVDVTMATVVGRTYTLQSSTALNAWENVAGAVAVAGTGAPLVLRDAAPGTGRIFYRVSINW